MDASTVSSSLAIPSPAATPNPATATATAAATAATPAVEKALSQGDTSLSSSPPRQFPTDLTSRILEEGDSESDTAVEPVTPVSGRQSQDFHSLPTHDSSLSSPADQSTSVIPLRPVNSAANKPPLVVNTAPAPPSQYTPTPSTQKPSATPVEPSSTIVEPATSPLAPTIAASEPSPTPPTHSRRNSRGLLSRYSLFRRSNSQTDKPAEFLSPNSQTTEFPLSDAPPKSVNRRWSMRRDPAQSMSMDITRSNSPPSPPINMLNSKDRAATGLLPGAASEHVDFNNPIRKKGRSSTGLTGLGRRAANFVTNGAKNNGQANDAKQREPQHRRASSFDLMKIQPTPPPAPQQPGDQTTAVELTRQPWAMPAEAGTGMKARRLSVSLPDDFTVDVAELLTEYEYHHKILGRHGKHLGKGATSKVTLMMRKGCPGELYAVKEFRGKSSAEKAEDYENKVKSEYSIAKSLHHPNIVETIRLCTDHGRWNHVMEYCSEGDLYGLVEKKYLREESRKVDRLCLFKQMIQGINYLHSNGIAHRDIKLENLLITKDSKLKITDFGVSEVFSGIHPGLREAGGQCGKNMGNVRMCSPGLCGSLPYISPEVLARDAPYDPRGLDVWGAGVVAINLFFGAPLWKEAKDDGNNPQYTQLVRAWNKWAVPSEERKPKYDSDGVPMIDENDCPKMLALKVHMNPPPFRRLVMQMLHPDPKQRCSMAAVANSRYLKGIECCQLESYDDPKTTIDASKKSCFTNKKIFCHNHLPPVASGNHSLGKMPGQPGYY